MKTVTATLICACMTLAASSVAAQDAAKKAPMKDDTTSKPMTMQECKDHMAMAKKEGAKKDEKKDAACAEMIKKEESMKKK